MRKLVLALLLFGVAAPSGAITLSQVRDTADARIEVIWPTVHDIMTACLLSSDGCYTTWSTDLPLCNTVTADSEVCQMAQVDPGLPDVCGLATGTQTFASTNTWNGATVVNDGTLALTGAEGNPTNTTSVAVNAPGSNVASRSSTSPGIGRNRAKRICPNPTASRRSRS